MRITYTVNIEDAEHEFYTGGMDEEWDCLICGEQFDEDDTANCHVVLIDHSDETICEKCWEKVKCES